MRRVLLDDLEPGMTVARTIVDTNNRQLLVQNTELTHSYINRLHVLGIGSVYIKDGLADIDIPQIVSDQVLTTVSAILSDTMNNLTAGKTIDVPKLKKAVSLLIEDILFNRNMLIQLEDIHTYNDYLVFHSINVAIFSIMTGLTMGYSEEHLSELGIGALMHDIGMICIDPAITKKLANLLHQNMNKL